MAHQIDPLEETKNIIKVAFPNDKILSENVDNMMDFVIAKQIRWKEI
jgi:hypothetical protein